MTMGMRNVAVLFVLGLGSACAHPRDAAAPTFVTAGGPLAAGAAQVCVLRPDSMARDVSMPVRDNGRLVGATRGATFFCWLAAPGEHQITSVDDDTGPMLLRARAGTHYWLHQDVTELAGSIHAHLDWVDKATAHEMIEECDDRVRVAVPGHDDEPAAMAIAPAKR
jgi:hypothetical protein